MNHRDTKTQRNEGTEIRADLNRISERVIGACIEVHRQLGPGLLESAYCVCVEHELRLSNIAVRREVAIPVAYKGVALDCGYRIDLLVDDRVIVELKTVDAIAAIHEAQLLTYLKLTELHLGLLINFNTPVLKSGIKRVVNGDPRPNQRLATT